MDHPKALMYDVINYKERINDLFLSINHDAAFFEDISLKMPTFIPAELGFIRTVSYLYVLYKEAGRVNLEIAITHLNTYNLDIDLSKKAHLDLVGKLRTYLQHNLDPRESSDFETKTTCEDWFLKTCSTKIPGNNSHWDSCSVGIIDGAIQLLQTVLECLRQIEADDSCDLIIAEWNKKRLRRHPPHEFDSLIYIVASDMGRDNIDGVKLRKRYYEQWTKKLSILVRDYKFEDEARKLIEGVLLQETKDVLPLTGRDIMEKFKIGPGPRIGELLAKAQKIYSESQCNKEELLQKL